MNDDLEKLKEIFLTGVDDETKAENLEQIRDWERSLITSTGYERWREHDITRQIVQEAKKSYTDIAVALATNRTIPESERLSLYARQDAMLWLVSVADRDVKGAIAQIQHDVRRALAAA